MSKSGGLTARNFREGFRSENLAEYVFSAFGSAVQVTHGNDLGIDLLCNLARFEGNMIFFESTYGVQIKSSGSPFVYKGKQASKWLSKLEYPLILADVNKETSLIKIYSTWNINNYLLDFHSEEENNYPIQLIFNTDSCVGSKLNQHDRATGLIPVGHPILEFEIKDLGVDIKREKYQKILSQWLDFDNENYKLRRSGIPYVFGYITWQTNEEISEKNVFDTKYFYSIHHTSKIRNLLRKGLTSLGLFNKASYDIRPLA